MIDDSIIFALWWCSLFQRCICATYARSTFAEQEIDHLVAARNHTSRDSSWIVNEQFSDFLSI